MKRIYLLFLALLTFFFMKNNTFADTTCKYSLSNVMRSVIQFNADGTVQFAGGAQSQLSDTKDYNLIMTIKNISSSATPNTLNALKLKDYVSFSFEGDKFDLALNSLSIYNYTVNGSAYNAYLALTKCPSIGIVFHQKTNNSDKYTIDNITSVTKPSNSDLPNLVKVYSKDANGTSSSKRIICVYGSITEQPYQAEINLEINGETSSKTVFRIKTGSNAPYQAAASRNVFRINDYNPAPAVSGVKTYGCNSYGYFDISDDGEIYPVSYKDKNDTRQLAFVKSYHLPTSSIFYANISLYDPNTNSGASGNPAIPGSKGYCELHPDALACKTKYSTSNKLFKFCDDAGMLKTLKIIHVIITIAKILIPILLIIFGSIEYGKAALADNQDAVEKTTQALIKKVIVGLLIFFIPTIVNALISFSQSNKDKGDLNGEFAKCALCFAGDKACDSYISSASK